jgi:outer membrane receptor protein involved in Fe transport
MEQISFQSEQRKKTGSILIMVIAIFISTGIYAQNKPTISGKVIDGKSSMPVPFASVVLFNDSVNAFSANIGTMTNENGMFSFSPVKAGKFTILVSSVGYKPTSEVVEVSGSDATDAGEIILSDSTFQIEEAKVVAERIKGKAEIGKTVFFVGKKIVDVSNSGIDILKFIPGIQVDLKHNITLEGSGNILIYVDGIERSKSYVSQLNPSQIDKVEIISTPPSGYDGNVTGVINIILKKEKNDGVSGFVNVEIPTSDSLIFLYPSLNVSYGFKKMNFFASYNGEINYENIDECVYRKKGSGASATEISTVQDVRQRNISHNFQYGFDYFLNTENQFNYYGFYNPYSYEQNGDVSVLVSGSENREWNALRTENDRNTGIFNSIYYKHIFNPEGSEIAFDISHYYLNADNTINYTANKTDEIPSYLNAQKMHQKNLSVKVDFTSPLGRHWTLSSGARTRFQYMKDRSSDGFAHDETVYAVYGTIKFRKNKTSLTSGLRAEDAEATLKNGNHESTFSLLPSFNVSYKISSKQNISVAFNRTVFRPSIFQLDSFTAFDDPYSMRRGNPYLKPEFRNSLNIEHNVQLKSGYFATRFFYSKIIEVKNNLTILNEEGIFETSIQNMGPIREEGVQFTGAFKAGPLAINPVLRFYRLSTSGNQLAQQNDIENRTQWVIEPSLSSILSLKKNFSVSAVFQYAVPKNNIQDNSYCEALYFISIDKTIKNRLKIGVFSALPFKNNFVYSGSKIKATDFYSRYEGNLRLNAIPLWIRINYQFHSGAKREKIERSKEEIDQRQKKGF